MRKHISHLVPPSYSTIRHWLVSASSLRVCKEKIKYSAGYTHTFLFSVNAQWKQRDETKSLQIRNLGKNPPESELLCSRCRCRSNTATLLFFSLFENLNLKSDLMCIALSSQCVPTPRLSHALLPLDILFFFAFLISSYTKFIKGSAIWCSCYAFLERSWTKHHSPCLLQALFSSSQG